MEVIKPDRDYSRGNLETLATKLRSKVENSRTRRMKAESVAEDIADYLELNIMWDSIPADNQGNIAAMIIPTKKLIYINEDIPALKSGFGQSTIAHEIGHWMLHINRDAVGEYIDREEQGIEPKIEPFFCRSQKSSKKIEKIERQAQHFAGCLLMPYHKLIKAKQGRDLTRWPHLYAIADEFGVTISNLRYRLKYLGWITYSNESKQIYAGPYLPN